MLNIFPLETYIQPCVFAKVERNITSSLFFYNLFSSRRLFFPKFAATLELATTTCLCSCRSVFWPLHKLNLNPFVYLSIKVLNTQTSCLRTSEFTNLTDSPINEHHDSSSPAWFLMSPKLTSYFLAYAFSPTTLSYNFLLSSH